MRIGFDLSALGRASAGVERVVREVHRALEERRAVELVPLTPAAGGNLRGWWFSEVPRRAREERLDGVHSMTSGFGFRGPGWRVQTVHELPWLHGVKENAGLSHRLWARLGGRRAARIVVPTEHVARDLARLGHPRAKVRVIPWAVDARFQDEPPAGVVDEAVLDRYRLGEEPFVLCLGAVREKKNLAAVLQGLAALRDRGDAPLRIVVSGPDTPDLRRDLGLASRLGLDRWVTTFEDLEEDDLPSLLRLATATAVLSRSEGFALPVLESLRCGTPVLVPAQSAQEETARGAGFVVDPSDPATVADALDRARREREDLRYSLSGAVGERSWDDVAADLEGLWSELSK